MKRTVPALFAAALMTVPAWAQQKSANGRLHIENVNLGMTADEFADDLRAKGWVSDIDRRAKSQPQASPSHALPPTSFLIGRKGEPGRRGLGVTYGYDRSRVERRVQQVLLNPLPRPLSDAVATRAEIERIFEEFVGLYGEPDACEPFRNPPPRFRRCTWTRPFNGVAETLHWQTGIGGRPSLRLVAGPGLSPRASGSTATTAPNRTPAAAPGGRSESATGQTGSAAASQQKPDVDAILERAVQGPFGRLANCGSLRSAMANGTSVVFSSSEGDVTIVRDGELLASKMPEACEN